MAFNNSLSRVLSRPASTTRPSSGRRAPGRRSTSRRSARPPASACAPKEPDPDHYAYEHRHCEVAVVGAGPAGLAAARAAARAGARVILFDEQAEFGGSLLADAHARSTASRRPNGSPRSLARTGFAAERDVAAAHAGLRLLRAEFPCRRGARHRPPRRIPIPSCRARGFGRCGRNGSSSRPARMSGRWCSPTTTGRASCSPIPRARSPLATASGRARAIVVATTHDGGYRAALDLAEAGCEIVTDRRFARRGDRPAAGGGARRAGCRWSCTRPFSARGAICASPMPALRGCGRTDGRASPTTSPATSSP